ncbi:MAG: restriction endonuclease, partial [Sedimenticola sp.]
WDNALAVISQFDLDEGIDGRSFLEIGSSVNESLVRYFLDHPTDLRAMKPRHFEELIAELFHGFGYLVELTAATRDDGRDVIAIGNEHIAASKYLIECKRYAETNKVGIQPVRSLHGVVTDERATKGIIATTSSFTAPANEFFARNKWTLEGRDFDGVVEWLKLYQKLKGLPSAVLQ